MGRPSEEFWELTYREIHACIEQYMDEREERLMLFGTVAASPLTVGSGGKKVFLWTDFFNARTPPPPPKQKTWEQMRDEWRGAHFSMVGTN